MLSGHNLKLLHIGFFLGGALILKDIISRPLNYAEQNGYLKILIRCVLVIYGCCGGGGGLVALQSLLTNKKDTSPSNIQSNEPFLKFPRQQMAISKFLIDVFRENTKCLCVWGEGGGVRGIHPAITLNLKKGTRNSDYQSNEPSPKFIRSPFLYKPYMPPGHNLQSLP